MVRQGLRSTGMLAALVAAVALATTTLTGAQVREVLEQGASGQHGMVQVSGLRFTYDPSQLAGSRVTSITVSATGQPIDPGANPVIYSDQLLSDAIIGYVRLSSPIKQQIESRITAP